MKITQFLILLLVLVSLTCDLHYITDIYQPEIEIISPKAGDDCIGEVHIELHATDNYELREIKLYFDGDIIETWEVTGEEATVTYTINLTDYSKSKDYEIKVQVWDKVGNWRKLTQENFGIQRKDCNGVIGGSAIINAFDYCVGGNTGLPENYCGTMTDIDGNVYQTVQIGNQLWMAENLKVTHYRNGDAIPTGLSDSQWISTTAGAYAVYNNNESNADNYGYLYNWYAVEDSRNIAPEGWHIPTDEEWMELEIYLGMSESEANSTGYRGTDQGSQLAGRADLWNNGNLENNSNFGTSGFTALPGGYRYEDIYYDTMGIYGYFLSSTEGGSNDAWHRRLICYYSEVGRDSSSKRDGFSVRCIRTVE